MSEFVKINEESLEEVVGGAIRTVHNDAVPYANVRETPGLHGTVAAKLANGTKVRTTGNTVKRDGYVWYEITLAEGSDYGWIAGSLIGY